MIVAKQMLLYTLFGEAFDFEPEGDEGDNFERDSSSRDSSEEETGDTDSDDPFPIRRTTAADRAARRAARQGRGHDTTKRYHPVSILSMQQLSLSLYIYIIYII